MKKAVYIISLFFIVLLSSCNTTQEAVETVLSGKVYYIDAVSGAVPVEGALVYTKTFYAQTTTDAAGTYQISFKPETDESEVTLVAGKAGFDAKEVNVLTKIGETVTVPDITLKKLQADTSILPVDTISVSGDAAHIEVMGNPDTHIYILSSGLDETGLISFKVTDAQGVAVDEEHQVTVNFSILNGPGGGEYLYPQSMETQNGIVYTILNSGVSAGPLQIEAKAEVNGQIIRTIPIRIAIYGGFPDPEHFSLSLERSNIAGRVHFGLIDYVTAFVGDKFSNPAAPGTIVYFSTDYGIVDGSAVTDEMGRAVVKYMSAEPLPPYPLTDPFAAITAKTYTDTLGQKTIESSAELLLSAATAPVQITPNNFTYNNTNSPSLFNYTVSDIHGHPIVGGSQLTVSATDGAVYGDINVLLSDTQSKGSGTTDFSFTWAPGDSLEAPQVYITITVSTPENGNGYRSTSILGTKSN